VRDAFFLFPAINQFLFIHVFLHSFLFSGSDVRERRSSWQHGLLSLFFPVLPAVSLSELHREIISDSH
jgi:hypothetical protein